MVNGANVAIVYAIDKREKKEISKTAECSSFHA